MKRLVLLPGVLLAGWVLLAGDGVHGPVTGYVFDARIGAIRPVQGLPGSSRLGEPLPLEMPMARCEVRSDKRIALCQENEGSAWRVVRWPETGPVQVGQGLVVQGSPTRVLINSTGEVALFLSLEAEGATGRIRWVRELADVPAIVADAVVPGNVRLLDLNERGERALLAEEGQLFVIDETGRREQLASGIRITAALFDDRGGVVFSDGGAGEVWQLDGVTAGALGIRLIAPADGASTPVALGFCGGLGDKRMVAVADAGRASVVLVNAAGVDGGEVSLMGKPDRLTGLDGGTVYGLNAVGSKPLWLFDCLTRSAFFVPLD